jgi:hypothetical protein
MNDGSLVRSGDRFPLGSQRLLAVLLLRAIVSTAGVVLTGCAALPPAEAPRPATPALPEASARGACPSCEEQARENGRLRQDLAAREAELRDLRSSQRDQVKVLQESTREVTRAKVKLRRLATQADAASYIAEVEVAMESLSASLGAGSTVPLMALAQSILQSTAVPFAQGDYGVAMDRAAQAEQLITAVAADRARPRSRSRSSGQTVLQVAIPLQATAGGDLRRQPLRSSPVVAALKAGSPVIAYAYRGSWLQVETEDGRSGWIAQRQVAAR